MELIIIELFLWAGLIFFIWALKDGLSQMESDIDQLGMRKSPHVAGRPLNARHYDQPDKVSEAIGSYKDAPIYHYAVIAGRHYRFDHVSPPDAAIAVQDGQRYVAPGLVYVLLDKPPTAN